LIAAADRRLPQRRVLLRSGRSKSARAATMRRA